MYVKDPNDHFKIFGKWLSCFLDGVKHDELKDEDRLAMQKMQVETLCSLELKFREAVKSHPWGDRVYRAFVDHVKTNKRNVLSARPYFRERQTVFAEHIGRSIVAGDIRKLMQFHVNSLFAKFVIDTFPWPAGSRVRHLYREILKLREDMATRLLPLTLNRVRIFEDRNPKSHLEKMDFIQTGVEGLMSGIDKYVPPFSKVFRSVLIGRMVGNFIDANTKPLLHFFPGDQRKLYQARKSIRRMINRSGDHMLGAEGIDYDALAAEVNKDKDGHILPEDRRTTGLELSELLTATSCISLSAKPRRNDDPEVEAMDVQAPMEGGPDLLAEGSDLVSVLRRALEVLSLLELKVLVMSGLLSFENYMEVSDAVRG